ncbi:MAG: rhodanese-like domain-containing protein [Spirochaetaceae bacterium]
MAYKIDREELKQKMDNGESFILVEVLAPKEYERLHIRGAENIPLAQIGREATSRFNKNASIVVYCSDSECSASPKAAQKLDTLGFTNVFDYAEGKADWVEAGYPVEGREA